MLNQRPWFTAKCSVRITTGMQGNVFFDLKMSSHFLNGINHTVCDISHQNDATPDGHPVISLFVAVITTLIWVPVIRTRVLAAKCSINWVCSRANECIRECAVMQLLICQRIHDRRSKMFSGYWRIRSIVRVPTAKRCPQKLSIHLWIHLNISGFGYNFPSIFRFIWNAIGAVCVLACRLPFKPTYSILWLIFNKIVRISIIHAS